jgi:hypothetical protein
MEVGMKWIGLFVLIVVTMFYVFSDNETSEQGPWESDDSADNWEKK